MKKVLISGYIGFDNFGDEALLHVLIKDLIGVGFERKNIVVISNNPAETTRKFNVEAFDRLSFFNLFINILNCNALIFIGGLFQDKTSFKSFLYYWAQLFLAEIFNKEIVFYGAGLGPFQRPITQKLFDFSIKSVRLLTLRDNVSATLLPYSRNTLISCDPVWSIETTESFKAKIKNINWDLPVLGVSLRNDKYLKDSHITRLGDKLIRLLDGMKDWQIVLIPCMPQDINTLYELYTFIEKKVSPPGKLIFLENFKDFSITEQAGIIANCSAMVSMRYHALLTSLANSKPVFGLIYDTKIKSLTDYANQVAIHFKEDLDQAWSYFWQNIEHSTKMAKIAREKSIELHKKNIQLLEMLFNLL